jgi:hypothetical protein
MQDIEDAIRKMDGADVKGAAKSCMTALQEDTME